MSYECRFSLTMLISAGFTLVATFLLTTIYAGILEKITDSYKSGGSIQKKILLGFSYLAIFVMAILVVLYGITAMGNLLSLSIWGYGVRLGEPWSLRLPY